MKIKDIVMQYAIEDSLDFERYIRIQNFQYKDTIFGTTISDDLVKIYVDKYKKYIQDESDRKKIDEENKKSEQLRKIELEKERNSLVFKSYIQKFNTESNAAQYIRAQQLNGEAGGIAYIQSIVGCDEKTALKLLDYFGRFRKVDHFKTEEDMTHTSLSKPTVQCPYCKSTNTHKITMTAKVVNTALFGLFGTKRNKQWHCDSCGSEW